MTEVLFSSSAETNADSTLIAFRVQEEQSCGGYLTARKAMVVAAARVASLRQLAAEQPRRVDYRDAYYKALDTYNHAAARTRLAFNAWHRSQLRSDARWTDTQGRTAGAA
ncbi:MAG TPA: hypothetical protein VHX38_00630 [Pseudonocardiaceae bacterium]|jgi:hypothetical protein|nr:hypothetical protein [Pseudonocardiaceae bacterium]